MWQGQVQGGTDGNDTCRINFCVRHVVVTFDVIKVHGLGYVGVLIQVHQIALQVLVIEDAANVALKVAVIHDIESHQRAEEPPVGFDDSLAE